MKKIGNWWCPDNTEIVNDMIANETFTCINSLSRAFKHVRQFNRAIDIGTWIGDSTTIMASRFHSVLGYEVSPDVYECCVRNLADRNVTNVAMHNIGMSNRTGEQNFYNGKCNFSGWISNKSDFGAVTITQSLVVKTQRLDDLDLVDIDFVKIDVDSHEGFLIDGAREFLTRNSPVILIENKERVHQERQDNMPNPAAILESLGYRLVEKVAKADFVFVKP